MDHEVGIRSCGIVKIWKGRYAKPKSYPSVSTPPVPPFLINLDMDFTQQLGSFNSLVMYCLKLVASIDRSEYAYDSD